MFKAITPSTKVHHNQPLLASGKKEENNKREADKRHAEQAGKSSITPMRSHPATLTTVQRQQLGNQQANPLSKAQLERKVKTLEETTPEGAVQAAQVEAYRRYILENRNKETEHPNIATMTREHIVQEAEQLGAKNNIARIVSYGLQAMGLSAAEAEQFVAQHPPQAGSELKPIGYLSKKDELLFAEVDTANRYLHQQGHVDYSQNALEGLSANDRIALASQVSQTINRHNKDSHDRDNYHNQVALAYAQRDSDVPLSVHEAVEIFQADAKSEGIDAYVESTLSGAEAIAHISRAAKDLTKDHQDQAWLIARELFQVDFPSEEQVEKVRTTKFTFTAEAYLYDDSRRYYNRGASRTPPPTGMYSNGWEWDAKTYTATLPELLQGIDSATLNKVLTGQDSGDVENHRYRMPWMSSEALPSWATSQLRHLNINVDADSESGQLWHRFVNRVQHHGSVETFEQQTTTTSDINSLRDVLAHKKVQLKTAFLGAMQNPHLSRAQKAKIAEQMDHLFSSGTANAEKTTRFSDLWKETGDIYETVPESGGHPIGKLSLTPVIPEHQRFVREGRYKLDQRGLGAEFAQQFEEAATAYIESRLTTDTQDVHFSHANFNAEHTAYQEEIAAGYTDNIPLIGPIISYILRKDAGDPNADEQFRRGMINQVDLLTAGYPVGEVVNTAIDIIKGADGQTLLSDLESVGLGALFKGNAWLGRGALVASAIGESDGDPNKLLQALGRLSVAEAGSHLSSPFFTTAQRMLISESRTTQHEEVTDKQQPRYQLNQDRTSGTLEAQRHGETKTLPQPQAQGVESRIQTAISIGEQHPEGATVHIDGETNQQVFGQPDNVLVRVGEEQQQGDNTDNSPVRKVTVVSKEGHQEHWYKKTQGSQWLLDSSNDDTTTPLVPEKTGPTLLDTGNDDPTTPLTPEKVAEVQAPRTLAPLVPDGWHINDNTNYHQEIIGLNAKVIEGIDSGYYDGNGNPNPDSNNGYFVDQQRIYLAKRRNNGDIEVINGNVPVSQQGSRLVLRQGDHGWFEAGRESAHENNNSQGTGSNKPNNYAFRMADSQNKHYYQLKKTEQEMEEVIHSAVEKPSRNNFVQLGGFYWEHNHLKYKVKGQTNSAFVLKHTNENNEVEFVLADKDGNAKTSDGRKMTEGEPKLFNSDNSNRITKPNSEPTIELVTHTTDASGNKYYQINLTKSEILESAIDKPYGEELFQYHGFYWENNYLKYKLKKQTNSSFVLEYRNEKGDIEFVLADKDGKAKARAGVNVRGNKAKVFDEETSSRIIKPGNEPKLELVTPISDSAGNKYHKINLTKDEMINSAINKPSGEELLQYHGFYWEKNHLKYKQKNSRSSSFVLEHKNEQGNIEFVLADKDGKANANSGKNVHGNSAKKFNLDETKKIIKPGNNPQIEFISYKTDNSGNKYYQINIEKSDMISSAIDKPIGDEFVQYKGFFWEDNHLKYKSQGRSQSAFILEYKNEKGHIEFVLSDHNGTAKTRSGVTVAGGNAKQFDISISTKIRKIAETEEEIGYSSENSDDDSDKISETSHTENREYPLSRQTDSDKGVYYRFDMTEEEIIRSAKDYSEIDNLEAYQGFFWKENFLKYKPANGKRSYVLKYQKENSTEFVLANQRGKSTSHSGSDITQNQKDFSEIAYRIKKPGSNENIFTLNKVYDNEKNNYFRFSATEDEILNSAQDISEIEDIKSYQGFYWVNNFLKYKKGDQTNASFVWRYRNGNKLEFVLATNDGKATNKSSHTTDNYKTFNEENAEKIIKDPNIVAKFPIKEKTNGNGKKYYYFNMTEQQIINSAKDLSDIQNLKSYNGFYWDKNNNLKYRDKGAAGSFVLRHTNPENVEEFILSNTSGKASYVDGNTIRNGEVFDIESGKIHRPGSLTESTDNQGYKYYKFNMSEDEILSSAVNRHSDPKEFKNYKGFYWEDDVLKYKESGYSSNSSFVLRHKGKQGNEEFVLSGSLGKANYGVGFTIKNNPKIFDFTVSKKITKPTNIEDNEFSDPSGMDPSDTENDSDDAIGNQATTSRRTDINYVHYKDLPTQAEKVGDDFYLNAQNGPFKFHRLLVDNQIIWVPADKQGRLVESENGDVIEDSHISEVGEKPTPIRRENRRGERSRESARGSQLPKLIVDSRLPWKIGQHGDYEYLYLDRPPRSLTVDAELIQGENGSYYFHGQYKLVQRIINGEPRWIPVNENDKPMRARIDDDDGIGTSTFNNDYHVSQLGRGPAMALSEVNPNSGLQMIAIDGNLFYHLPGDTPALQRIVREGQTQKYQTDKETRGGRYETASLTVFTYNGERYRVPTNRKGYAVDVNNESTGFNIKQFSLELKKEEEAASNNREETPPQALSPHPGPSNEQRPPKRKGEERVTEGEKRPRTEEDMLDDMERDLSNYEQKRQAIENKYDNLIKPLQEQLNTINIIESSPMYSLTKMQAEVKLRRLRQEQQNNLTKEQIIAEINRLQIEKQNALDDLLESQLEG